MGTTISVAVPGGVPGPAARAVRSVFAQLEDRFTLYRDSEGQRVARGELAVKDASAEYRDAYELAQQWRRDTFGAFTPRRPDGAIDLAGVVKALAIQGAADTLVEHGCPDWCINAGGDVLVRGRRADGSVWVLGIVDPDDRGALLTQHTAAPALPALATSGTTERGEHVWRVSRPQASQLPRGVGADAFRQVSVAGPDILTADVLATAILAGGPRTLEHALTRWPIEVIAARTNGELLATPGFRA